MKKFHEICTKIFFGALWIKLPFMKNMIGFPKLAPLMIVAMTLSGLFQEGSFKNIPFLFWTGIVLLIIGIFGFFYPYYLMPTPKDGADNIPEWLKNKKS